VTLNKPLTSFTHPSFKCLECDDNLPQHKQTLRFETNNFMLTAINRIKNKWKYKWDLMIALDSTKVMAGTILTTIMNLEVLAQKQVVKLS
jgi:hypothetical protein